VGAPDFASNRGQRRQPRCLIEPAFKDDPSYEAAGFPRQNDEDNLGDFLGLMRVARVPKGDLIDLVDVPPYKRGEGVLRAALDVCPQQGDVIQFLHVYMNCRQRRKRYKQF